MRELRGADWTAADRLIRASLLPVGTWSLRARRVQFGACFGFRNFGVRGSDAAVGPLGFARCELSAARLGTSRSCPLKLSRNALRRASRGLSSSRIAAHDRQNNPRDV